jgi:uracil phosphoribosyltransferase
MRHIPTNVHCIDHPLIQNKLAILRQKTTVQKEFRELVHEITLLLAYEATRHLTLTTTTVDTPLETFTAPCLPSTHKPVIVPILRAGLGMVDAFLTLLPEARVGHIGIFRNEKTLQPQHYYFKIPKDSADSCVFVCDPMLATGGSVVAAIHKLKEQQVKQIIFICIVAAPEGIHVLTSEHPDIPIYTASIDRELNPQGYILPGLGDAGDRLFGTV